MSYLLTLGWPWFAAACGLGALAGYVTTSPAKDAPAAPGWNVIAIAVTLGAGAAASWLGLLDGRAALTMDVLLIAALAYLVGLPVGGALKTTQAAPAYAAKRPIVVFAARRATFTNRPSRRRPNRKMSKMRSSRLRSQRRR